MNGRRLPSVRRLGIGVRAAGGLALLGMLSGLGATPARQASADIAAPPGFDVELLYEPNPEREGSWVALCAGPDGTLFSADQYGSIYQVTPPPVEDGEGPTRVRRLGVEVRGAQGLCWAFGSLYVMATGEGLLRLTDADGDGTFEQRSLLLAIEGAGEHGTHAVIPDADGESLLFVCGNHTPPPELDSSRFAEMPREDVLLERDPDPRGHAVGIPAPGGYICRIGPDGGRVEMLASGFRNCYDIAVDANGEILTFDSDMEWDLGLPWYRPARICHAVSGADFGWRHGSAKWPAYYEDSVPSVIDVGPASPTGVLFGTGLAFPTRYQEALFCLDWTYGIIYAAHLEPSGASFDATLERFVVGKPLPLTDAAVGDDGALYFTTGGRRLGSGFYRVVYRGNESTRAPAPRAPTDAAARRHELEALHRDDAPASGLDPIWTALGSDDRILRHAALVALEHQPADRYRDRALGEADAPTRVEALLALARVEGEGPGVIDALLEVDVAGLDEERRLAWLRAIEVACMRSGAPEGERRSRLVDTLAGMLPSGDGPTDAELVRLLVFLDASRVIEPALDLLDDTTPGTPPEWASLVRQNDVYGAAVRDLLDRPPPTAQLAIARMLSTLDEGWSLEQRQRYFAMLRRAEASGGGMSYQGYIASMRRRALAQCDDAERLALAPLVESGGADEGAPPVPPRGPGRVWTVDQAYRTVDGSLRGRSFERGAGLFRSGVCASCHQINGVGANAGPDLTSVANTYPTRDMLRAIIEPSHEVSSQYAMTVVETTDGTRVTGLLVDADDEEVVLAPSFLDPTQVERIPRARVRSMSPSPVSPMPQGLLNAFGPNDLRDLVAYLLAGGDPESPVYDR